MFAFVIRRFHRFAQMVLSDVVAVFSRSVASVTSVDEKGERVEGACKADCDCFGYPQISQICADDLVECLGGFFSICGICDICGGKERTG